MDGRRGVRVGGVGEAGGAEGRLDPLLDRGDRRRRVEVVGQGGEHPLDVREGRRTVAEREGAAPGGEGVDGVPELVVGPLPVAAVVVAQQHEPDRHRVDLAHPQRGDEDEVALGLRHLLAVVGDHPGVGVGAREPLPRVGDLRVAGGHLVVREDEVAATALHVERGAEVVERDRGALDVPARSAGAPRAVPRRLARSLGAPQHAVEGVLLAIAVGVATALGVDLEHRAAVEPGHRAEGVVGGHREVEVVLDAVDRPGLVESLDQLDHLRDGLDRPGVVRGRQDPQGLHVLAEELGLALGELGPVDADLGGALEQRVVDVRHVLDVGHLVPGVAPGAVEEVEADVGRRVTHVGGVVGSDPADVHPRRALGPGLDEGIARGVVHPHDGARHGQ